MATLATVDGYIKRVADGYCVSEPLLADFQSTLVAPQGGPIWCREFTYTVPTLETGVAAYIPLALNFASSLSTGILMIAKCIDLGHLDISGPTFTDGSAMPTVTELGSSRQVGGGVMCEVTTALNATPGNMTVTYKDQDGNGTETTTSTALGASFAAVE